MNLNVNLELENLANPWQSQNQNIVYINTQLNKLNNETDYND